MQKGYPLMHKISMTEKSHTIMPIHCYTHYMTVAMTIIIIALHFIVFHDTPTLLGTNTTPHGMCFRQQQQDPNAARMWGHAEHITITSTKDITKAGHTITITTITSPKSTEYSTHQYGCVALCGVAWGNSSSCIGDIESMCNDVVGDDDDHLHHLLSAHNDVPQSS